jgi:hypothetical protein
VPGVVGHRLHSSAQHGRINGVDVSERLVASVAIP